MYFALKPDCYFRYYGNIGHIIIPVISKEEIVDESGAIFVEQLEYEPKDINQIVAKLEDYFDNVDTKELKKDAMEFYMNLVTDGFLNASETLEEFRNNGFDYSLLEGKSTYKSFNTQLEESSSHFLGEYFKENPFLETFHIELTSKCNERCVHCYIPHEKKNTEIDYDLMIKVLDQCKEMNVLTVIFSGGEPMLHPYFCDFLRYAKDLDFNVTVLSNLTLLNDDIIQALKYKHVSSVNVSLYSMEPNIHDEITTVNGSFEKTKNNILQLLENNIAVQINCPVMKQNKSTFYEVIKWGQKHKCSVVTDYLITARFDRTTDNLVNRITTDELKDVIYDLAMNDVVTQADIHSKKLSDPDQDSVVDPEDKVCGVGMSTLCMVANGDIYPCAGWQKYICGNLKNETLKKIWEDSPAINYLRKLRQKDFKQCLGCADYDYCLMCMGRNSNEDENGNIFNIPPITCEAARIHHEMVRSFKNGGCDIN